MAHSFLTRAGMHLVHRWSGIRGRHAKAAKRIEAGRRQLQDVSGAIERRFLQISEELEAMTQASEQVLGGAQKLIEVTLGRGDGGREFQDCLALILEPVEFSAASLNASRSMNRRLAELDLSFSSLLSGNTVFERVMGSAAIVEVMLRIECAGLPEDAQLGLLALGEKIRVLREQISGAIAQEMIQIERGRGTLSRARQHLRQLETREQDAMARRQALEAGLAALQGQIHANEDFNPLLRESEDLKSVVDRVVRGIQFQDIVSQRLGHINVGLQRIERDLASRDQVSLVQMAELAVLESAQLSETAQTLRSASEDMNEALGSVMDVVERLETWCVRQPEVRFSTSAGDGIVQTLLDSIEEVNNLMREMGADLAETHRVLSPMANLGSSFGQTIDQVSVQMRLIALNAQIQAAQFGARTGMDVLAASLCDIADQTGEHARAFGSRASGLSDALASIVQESNALWERCSGVIERFAAEAPARVAILHGYRDQCLKHLATTTDQLEIVRTSSESARAAAVVREDVDAVFSGLRAALEELAALPGYVRPAGGQLTADLMRSYTMEAERNVHRSVFATTGAAEAVPEASLPLPATGNDIELF